MKTIYKQTGISKSNMKTLGHVKIANIELQRNKQKWHNYASNK